MKKILLTLLLLPILNNCTQYSALVGPSYTLMNTGSILQTTTSLSGSLAITAAKNNYVNDLKNENICPTVHTSELNEMFFETLEHLDCFYDPMSIHR
jgi:hypothetical protein